MLSALSGCTDPPFMYFDTVDIATPAFFATSLMVANSVPPYVFARNDSRFLAVYRTYFHCYNIKTFLCCQYNFWKKFLIFLWKFIIVYTEKRGSDLCFIGLHKNTPPNSPIMTYLFGKVYKRNVSCIFPPKVRCFPGVLRWETLVHLRKTAAKSFPAFW